MTDEDERTSSGEPEIASLAGRIKALEKEAPTPEERALTKFGARAGLFATILSILTGGFAIYSETVVKPLEEKDKTFQQFTTYIQQLASAGPRLATIARTTPDPIERQTLLGAINTERLVALDGAEQLLPHIAARVSAPQLIMLAQVKSDLGDVQATRKLLSQAIDKSEGPMKAEALRQRGRAISMTGNSNDRASAMADFGAALDLLTPIAQWGASVTRVSVLHDWIIGENTFGSCVKTNELVPKFLEEIQKQDVSNDTRLAYRADLKQALSFNNRCSVNLASIN